MSAATLPDLLTSVDVGTWLALPASRVERMARRGEIPCRRLPTGELVFDAGDLAGWAQALPPAATDGKGADGERTEQG